MKKRTRIEISTLFTGMAAGIFLSAIFFNYQSDVPMLIIGAMAIAALALRYPWN